MEKILSLLFDYQRFLQNPKMIEQINATEERCLFRGVPLSDEELELNAAGDMLTLKNSIVSANEDPLQPHLIKNHDDFID